MIFPVFSIPSDHTLITDHRDTDHIVTREGEARKARKGSNDNRGEPGEHPRTQHPTHSSAQLSPQPSLDLVIQLEITWRLITWVGGRRWSVIVYVTYE